MKKVLSTLLMTLFVGTIFAAPFKMIDATYVTKCGTLEHMRIDTNWSQQEIKEYTDFLDDMACS